MDFQPLLHAFLQEGTSVVGRTERGTDLTGAFVVSHAVPLEPRLKVIEDVLSKKADAVKMLTEEARSEMLAVAEYLRDTHVDQPEVTGKIGLLELALHIRQKAYRSVSPGVNFETLLHAFEPVDPVAGFQQRIDAIGSRLIIVAQSTDKLSSQQRATMYEATKYAMELQLDGENILGKIMFMESALGTQPTNLRVE